MTETIKKTSYEVVEFLNITNDYRFINVANHGKTLMKNKTLESSQGSNTKKRHNGIFGGGIYPKGKAAEVEKYQNEGCRNYFEKLHFIGFVVIYSIINKTLN